jgi:hypothetical protein
MSLLLSKMLLMGLSGRSGPSLNFNFVDGSAFSPQITFTRASSAAYFDATGTLQSAAIDVPRFDYDPATLAARGFLIEEQRTNSIRNNTMVGASAGTPGTNPTNWSIANTLNGLTKEIVGTGTTNGITWIDLRWSGTTTATSATVAQPEGITAITAATGQSWSASAWWAIVGGSTANITAVNQRVSGRSAAGSLLEQTDQPVTLTATLTRYTASRTMVNASTERVTNDIFFSYNSGVAIDITLRIGLPQLELGAFATSVIPTTTTSLTRSADVASVDTLSPWYRADEGTVYAEVGYQQTNPSSAQHAASFNDATTNNRWTASFTQTTGLGLMLRNTSGAGLLQTSAANAAIVGATNKIALAISTGASLVLNGGTVATNASYAAPTVTRLELGKQLAAGYFNGYLRRITYYPRRLTDTQLQQITA